MLLKFRPMIAVSCIMLAGITAQVNAAALSMPQPPAIMAGSYVLMDYTTGQILAANNEHQQRNPASLTKLMTGYVVDRAIDSHRITPDDVVTVGKDAWAKDNPVFEGSSLMFLKAGDRVTVRDLSRGLIVDSGNDACVALA
ncbi:serine hydrolase, partial [Cronobacter sakazakii]